MENKEDIIEIKTEDAVEHGETVEKEISDVNGSISEEQDDEPVKKTKEKTKHKSSKKVAFLVTFALIMSIILCIWVISQVLSNGYISIGGYSLFRVASGSMEPEIPVGTLLVSKETEINEIDVNDVVNFRSKDAGMMGMIITHRVIGIYNGIDGEPLLQTKGDANPYADSKFVDEENLVGKVVYATGEGNFFADLIGFLTSKIGFWSFIVLPCILVGVGIMRDTIGSLRNEMDVIHKELDAMTEKTKKQESELDQKEETYEEMYERLRKELLEELNQSAEQVEIEEAPVDKEQ